MSEPFRRGGRRAWTVTVRWDGEGHQIALGTRDERKALLLAAALRLKVEAGEWQPPQAVRSVGLSDVKRDYVAWYVSAAGEDRIEARTRAWRSDGCQLTGLFDWLEKRGRSRIDRVTASDAIAFIDERRLRGSIETTRRVIRIAKALWNWAIVRELARENPWRNLALPRRALADPRNLSDLEIARLLDFVARYRFRAVWEFAACGLYAGMRLGEILALQVEDLDAGAGLLRVRPFKHGPARDSLYPRELRAILETRAQAARERVERGGDGRLFPEATEGWGKRAGNLLSAAGIKASLHDLRRTFAGLLARNGVPVTRIRDYLGHESSATTESYYVGRAEAVAGDGEVFSAARGRRRSGAHLGAAAKRRRGAAS